MQVATPGDRGYAVGALRYPAVVVCVVLCACSADDVVDVTFDPCSPQTPLTLVPGGDVEAPEVQGVADAVAAWGGVLPVTIEVGDVGAWPADGPALAITFESGDTPYRAMYWDTLGEISISREHLAPGDYGLAIAHELGHAFGLLHVSPDDRASVMNVGNLEVEPTAEDAAAVRALWASCASYDHGTTNPQVRVWVSQ